MRARRRGKRVQWDAEGIHALRRHLGLTQQQIADELGTRQQTISEWEIGMYRPRGASSRLLTIIAERAGFDYEANRKGGHGERGGAEEGADPHRGGGGHRGREV